MYTFWLNTIHWDGKGFVPLEHPTVTVTHKGHPIPLREVPQDALADVMTNIHGLLNNGRWTSSL